MLWNRSGSKPNVAVRIGTSEQSAPARSTPSVFSCSVDESLAKLANSKIFSKLDAKSGFWLIPLSKESSLLTTFGTPIGRLCMNRLPFGICSASELFQRTVSEILADVEGAVRHMDDDVKQKRKHYCGTITVLFIASVTASF